MGNKIPKCRLNPGVECNTQERCGTCGWNPYVTFRRLSKKFGKVKANEMIIISEKNSMKNKKSEY